MLASTSPERSNSADAQRFVFPRHFRSALFQFADDARRVPLDREIQIADGHSGDHVAHGAADEIQIGLGLGGEFLDANHCGALLRGEPAFELEHVIRHAYTVLGRRRRLLLCVPAPDRIYRATEAFPWIGFWPSRARVMRFINLLQALLDHVRVNLSRGNIRVAQHELDRAEVRTPFQQVRGKTVTQLMRREAPAQAQPALHNRAGSSRC